MVIPCEECITYAICKNKREIECQILWDASGENPRALLTEVRWVLPNLEYFVYENIIMSSTQPHFARK